MEKPQRCKKGTRKYKPLGDGCYSITEIDEYKRKKTRKKVGPVEDILISDE